MYNANLIQQHVLYFDCKANHRALYSMPIRNAEKGYFCSILVITKNTGV